MATWLRELRSSRTLIVVLGLALLAGLILWYFELLPRPVLALPPSWQGVTLGQTTVEEAFALWGRPTKLQFRGTEEVYVYENPEKWGWAEVELWTADRGGRAVVIGVLRAGWYQPNPDLPKADIQNLGELVSQYGRPTGVYWSGAVWYRFLIWAEKGVAAQVAANAGWSSRVGFVLSFEPMGIRQFLRTPWPWFVGGSPWTLFNQNTGGDTPDTFERDPYDWEHMPTPER